MLKDDNGNVCPFYCPTDLLSYHTLKGVCDKGRTGLLELLKRNKNCRMEEHIFPP